MRRIIIASHHEMAAGVADTLRFIAGDLDIVPVCAFMDETPLESQLEEAFSGVTSDDEVLVLTDVRQGSVNQACLPYRSDSVFLVTGINLPCALELALYPARLTADFIRDVVNRSRDELQLVNGLHAVVDELDE